MKQISCDIIKDVLPLYYDNVCSEPTRAMVEEHIAECEDCRTLLQKMSIDMVLPTGAVTQHKMEGAELQLIAKRWNRSKLIAFAKGLIIATSICGLLFLGYIGLFKWNITNAPIDSVEITDVSQLKNGRIVFHSKLTDGYDLNQVSYKLDDEGDFYMTPVRPIIKSKQFPDKGLANMYHDIDVEQQSVDRNKKIRAVYWGTPEDRILIWQEGTKLPPASEEVEAEYKH